MTKEDVVAMEVEAPVVEKKKKKKKSKKVTAEAPAVAEVESAKRKAEGEHEDAPKKKKSKKNKTEEPAAMEVEVEEPEKKKKKKKKSKDAEAAAAPAEEEAAAPAAEEGEKKKKKKKKKSKDAAEEKAEEPAAEEAEEKAEEAEEKEAEEAEEKEAEEPAEEAKTEVLSVFIGGLPWSADEETVKKDFGECGEITGFRMLMDRETGRPKGSAFCDFATTDAVKAALEFNETEYGGRTIYVREVNDDGKGKGKKGKKGDGKKGKGKKGGKGPSEKPEGCKSLIVKSLSYETTEDSLWTLFEGMNVERVKLLTDRETGSSKGIAFVDFADEAGVDEGIKKSNTELDGRYIFIDYSGGKGDGKGKDGKKGKGKDGKKGGKGKGKKGGKSDPVRSANQGSIVEATGTSKAFDSDSD